MIQVCLEIIATTYRSTNFKTYAFSLYSHLFIYVSIQLPVYTLYIWTCSMRWLKTIRGTHEDDDRANSEIHSEPVIEQVWRCTWRPWWSEFGDAVADRDWVNSEMHWEAVIERVWRCTLRPRSSELRAALRGRNRAGLEMHLEAEIDWTQKCTGRL